MKGFQVNQVDFPILYHFAKEEVSFFLHEQKNGVSYLRGCVLYLLLFVRLRYYYHCHYHHH